MTYLNDSKAIYLDGSKGGLRRATNLLSSSSRNINASNRNKWGKKDGVEDAKIIIRLINDDEKIHIITHSMGAAYAKGYIDGLNQVLGDDFISKIEWEIDIAPYQPEKQQAAEGVPTGLLQHEDDKVAKSLDMEGMKYKESTDTGTSKVNILEAHSLDSFSDEILGFLIRFMDFLANKNNGAK